MKIIHVHKKNGQTTTTPIASLQLQEYITAMQTGAISAFLDTLEQNEANTVATQFGNQSNKWKGRIIIEIEAPTRREAKRILKEMFSAYGFAEKPAGVKAVTLGNVTQ